MRDISSNGVMMAPEHKRRISEPYGPMGRSPGGQNHHHPHQNNRSASVGGSGGIEEIFYCLLCIEPFTVPKRLNCKHVFCDACLTLYFKAYRNDNRHQAELSILCPTCRKPTKLPPNGIPVVDLLKRDIKMSATGRKMSAVHDLNLQRCEICKYRGTLEESEYFCIKCGINLCGGCRTLHTKEELFKLHQVIHISNKDTVNLYCDTHSNQQCDYYCSDCSVIACTVCIINQHAQHNNKKLRDALQTQRDNIKTLLNVLGPKLDKIEMKLNKLLQQCPSRKVSSDSNRSSDRDGVPVTTTTTATGSSGADTDGDSVIGDGSFDMEERLTEDQQRLRNLQRLYDFSTKLLEPSFAKKLLALYDDLMLRIQTATELEMKQLYDDVDEMSHKQTLSVCSNDSDPIGCSSSIDGECHSIEENTISTSTPHSLLIKLQLKWKMEKLRCDQGELWNPSDLAFLPDNMLVVAEYDVSNEKNSRNNRIHIFDQSGRSINTITEEKLQPLGVCVTQDGSIAVTDCQEKRVKIFTTCGIFNGEFGKGMFGWPYGIAVTSKGQFVVSDAFNDFISVHSPDGRRTHKFGASGSENAEFQNPYHVAIDRNDNIIVSDCGNNCIKVFDINGKFISKTTRIRNPNDGTRRIRNLKAPRGVAVDIRGNILVADDHARVSMFTSSCKYNRNILTEEDSVKFPEGLATNNTGLLAVTEWNPHNMFAIKVFSMYE